MSNPRGDFQLALGYWIVSHREQLRKWWVLALLGFIGLSLLGAIVFFTTYFAQQSKVDQLIQRTGSEIVGLRLPSTVLPQDLETSAVTIIPRSASAVDLVAFVTNPNTQWGAALVDYHFVLGDSALPGHTAFVNSDDDRPLVQLNVPMTEATAQAGIVIDHIQWARSASATLTTPNFSVADIVLSPTNVTLAGKTFLTYNVKATMTNRSVFNFLRVAVPIVLRSGDRIVAVDQFVIDRWATLAEKSISHTWNYPVSQATQAAFDPQASQFDETNLFE